MANSTTICVYCGANPGLDADFATVAQALGAGIAGRGHRLVYGGGRVGLMGAVADGVLDAGGEVIGIIPRDMVERELAHTGATELIITEGMHDRKAEMERHADGFIALPGGFGTLDETMEMLTWNQIGYVAKPLVFLDVNGYWEALFGFFDHAQEAGLIQPAHRAMAQRATTVGAALDLVTSPAPSTVSKWTDPTVVADPAS